MRTAANIPSGTVTFLFTDIENSAIIAQKLREDWERLRARHHAILQSAIRAHRGYVFQIIGDAFCVAFDTVRDGVQAALDGQRRLQAEAWGEMPIRVRMGVHTGEAQAREGGYRGYLTLTRVKRVMSVAYGGQILLSNSSAELVREALPDDVNLRDLGQHRLKSLLNNERIWQLIVPGLREDFPALESLSTVPSNLPPQLTSFVGREKEIADICALLHTHRLVTLTGAGGTGKTRLALEVAEEALGRFKDGVWFIELGPLSDGGLVPNTIASVLGVREEQGRPLMTTFQDWIRKRETLLLLDNCEHLIDSCARFSDAILHGTRETRILSTSHEALGITGETVYHVPSLESPGPNPASKIPAGELAQYEAVRLFTERASEALTTFNLTDANASAVAQICHRLDGIPLAIELAAARVRALHVEQIAERLDDRFRLLTSGGRTALPRHQTLRSLIDWSHGLLSEPEKVLFRRLSVFAGGWSLEAAEEICAGHGLELNEILDLLAHLVDKSLVLVDEAPGETRYRMLETIRQYALERLTESGELESLRTQHLKFLMALAERAAQQFHGREEPASLDRLELEIGNLRLALEWALTLEDTELGLQLAASLYWFWWTRGYWEEGPKWLGLALGKPGAERPTKGRAKALTALGWFLFMSGDIAKSRDFLHESVDVARRIADKHILAESLAGQGLLTAMLDESAVDSELLKESLALARELGDKSAIGMALVTYGQLKTLRLNHEEAEASYEEGAALLGEIGDTNMRAFAVRRLGHIALRRGDCRRAFALCAESLRLNRDLGHKQGVAASLGAIASIAAKQGAAVQAARLYGATAALLESFGGQFGGKLNPTDQAEVDLYMSIARADLGEDVYARAFSEGRAMNMDQAVAYALEQVPR